MPPDIKGYVIPPDFLRQLWEGKNRIWPTCLECGADLGKELKPGDRCPKCGTVIQEQDG